MTDYEIGYGKAPIATRFKKGVTGNPNGRPTMRPIIERAGRLPRGVTLSRSGRQYFAQISIGGVKQALGYFDTAEEASFAYEAARAERPERPDSVAIVRSFLQQNLGCLRKEIVTATGLHPRVVNRAIKIIRREA